VLEVEDGLVTSVYASRPDRFASTGVPGILEEADASGR
jgi:hypothetical protein